MAFGVGMKITDTLAQRILPAEGAGPSLSERVEKIERRLETMEHPVVIPPADGDASFDQRVVTGVMTTVDERFREHEGKLDSRVAEVAARLAGEVKSLDRRLDTFAGAAQAAVETLHGRIRSAEETAFSVREYVDEKIAELRGQMVAINHEFAQAVAGIVREEVTRHVEARAAAIERALQDQILLLVDAAMARRSGGAPPESGAPESAE